MVSREEKPLQEGKWWPMGPCPGVGEPMGVGMLLLPAQRTWESLPCCRAPSRLLPGFIPLGCCMAPG